MKKILLAALFMFTFSVSVFALGSTLEVKGGVQYPSDLEKVGFDSAATLNIGVDKYFTFGAETGFGWLKWKDEAGDVGLGNFTVTESTTNNLYTLPLLAVARIRMADMMESNGFMPYVSGGIGYSWTWYKLPDETYRFSGLTWQGIVGVEVKLGADSNLSLIVEGGYKGATLTNSAFLLK
ncbi:MAG: hypothetical protein CVV49_07970 [Spirochaetae bacterium HGW-Spirochaetae-5]|nr:MAG: hypothetical protein CVV49_07970 [Spirochaetae bacterium HGW-Spirochaetae-5]